MLAADIIIIGEHVKNHIAKSLWRELFSHIVAIFVTKSELITHL